MMISELERRCRQSAKSYLAAARRQREAGNTYMAQCMLKAAQSYRKQAGLCAQIRREQN